MIGIEKASRLLDIDRHELSWLIRTGAIRPTEALLVGPLLKERTVRFTKDDLQAAREELDRRRFTAIRKRYPSTFDVEAKLWFGPGWFRILEEAAAAVEQAGERIIGGKEKFGVLVLRMTWTAATRKTVSEIYETAKASSLKTCEECGKPGQLRRGPVLYKTVCDDHAYLVGASPM